MITTILHFLGILFGVAGIGCAVGAVTNMLIARTFTDDMCEDAWPYVKKTYIFLGLTSLLLVIGYFLNTL
jgi:hypothetical protein